MGNALPGNGGGIKSHPAAGRLLPAISADYF